MKRIVLAGILLASFAIPTAYAHAPPPAKEYETRVLADYNDDWFGTQDGHNLVSLDVQEAYNATFGENVLIFRLMISGGYAATGGGTMLTDHITFKADGQDRELTFSTADNAAFTGTFDAVYGPEPVLVDGAQDGSRVFITGVSRFSTLGIDPGSKLTEWFVVGHADDAEADKMPEGLAPGLPEPPGTSGQVWFDIGEYTVRAPDFYVSVAVEPAALALAPGNTSMLNVTVKNLLADTPQSFLVHANGTGIDLANGKLVDLAGGAEQVVQISVALLEGSGTIPVFVTATSTLGGLATKTVTITAPAAVASNATSSHGDGHDDDHDEEKAKDTPGPAFLATLALLGAATVIMRRRI